MLLEGYDLKPGRKVWCVAQLGEAYLERREGRPKALRKAPDCEGAHVLPGERRCCCSPIPGLRAVLVGAGGEKRLRRQAMRHGKRI